MKQIIVFISILFFFLGFVTTAFAQSPLQGEHVRFFKENLWIQTDGSIKVEERIVYDFGSKERHGIFRDIPSVKTNKEGKKYKMDINVVSVVDENNEAYNYDLTKGDTLQIKIGDPDKTVSGEHIYIITYIVKGALTYFSDHDELYWNITGNDWEVPIAGISAQINMPTTVPSDQIQVACYTGVPGSVAQECTTEVKGSMLQFEGKKILQGGEGFTVVAGFPKGIVSIVEPTEVKPFSSTILGKLTILALIIIMIFWYIVLPVWLPIRWWLKGRDPQSAEGVATAWFDPPKTKSGRNLTPAETGTLVDEHASMKEISALIINLAQRGYLKIVEKGKKDYEFVKTKEYADDGSLQGFEQTFLKEIFSGKEVLRLKDAELATEVTKVQDALYESLVKEGYFPENPDKVRKRYTILTVLSTITFNFFLLVSSAVFGRLMPRKSLEGVQASNRAKSLRNFLSSQEKQLEFQAKNQMMFEKLLPFAIAFGVEKIWADRFKDITLTAPEWFVSSQAGVFNAQTFTHSLGSSMSSFQSAATPVTSSTGYSSGFSGGSSGGGGGGGGGGSW